MSVRSAETPSQCDPLVRDITSTDIKQPRPADPRHRLSTTDVRTHLRSHARIR